MLPNDCLTCLPPTAYSRRDPRMFRASKLADRLRVRIPNPQVKVRASYSSIDHLRRDLRSLVRNGAGAARLDGALHCAQCNGAGFQFSTSRFPFNQHSP